MRQIIQCGTDIGGEARIHRARCAISRGQTQVERARQPIEIEARVQFGFAREPFRAKRAWCVSEVSVAQAFRPASRRLQGGPKVRATALQDPR